MSTVQSAEKLVVFAYGDEEYALPITDVKEIIRYVEPRHVSTGNDWLVGVISLRGQIIPVCDLAKRLNLPFTRDAAAKIVIVETADGQAGVIVDDVRQVLPIDDAVVDELPVSGDGTMQAIVKLDDRLIVLLDADKVLEGAGQVV